MQVVNTKLGNTRDGGTFLVAFEFSETRNSAGNGSAVLIPSDIKSLTVTVSFTGGATGYVEATTDRLSSVKNDTAIWVPWRAGTVSTTTQDKCCPPSAIRMVMIGTGTMLMSMRGQ